jgi:predicted aconitase with swiveling domain
MIRLKGRRVVGGVAEGVAVVSKEPISFFGGVDPKTGKIIEKGHALEGVSVAGKVLIFPHGKGSTVGSYILYAMAKNKVAPAAVINVDTEPIIVVGCCLAGIPLVDKLDKDPVRSIKNGDTVRVLAYNGLVEVVGRSQ